jgi:hypothetical protein
MKSFKKKKSVKTKLPKKKKEKKSVVTKLFDTSSVMSDLTSSQASVAMIEEQLIEEQVTTTTTTKVKKNLVATSDRTLRSMDRKSSLSKKKILHRVQRSRMLRNLLRRSASMLNQPQMICTPHFRTQPMINHCSLMSMVLFHGSRTLQHP